ncbi:MAG TPA: hypothetical protein DHW63_11085 [Hyphomonadaceae bacterium]|nr:hypothetical protein [Hyphomonadaceae bacterium]
MRHFVFILPLALLACGQPQSTSRGGCDLSATHEITWSNPDAPDTVTARADGPSCRQAAITLTIRNAQGDPLWAFASSHYAMTAGDGALPADAPEVTEASMTEFLANWADVTMQSSGELPEWREGEPALRGETFSYHTTFEREAYEMLRGRDLPMACYAGGAETSQCLAIDPLSNAPTLLVAYGP